MIEKPTSAGRQRMTHRSFTEPLLWEKLDITYNDMDTFDQYLYLISLETSDINVVWDMLDSSNPLLSQRPPNGGVVQALTRQSSNAESTMRWVCCCHGCPISRAALLKVFSTHQRCERLSERQICTRWSCGRAKTTCACVTGQSLGI